MAIDEERAKTIGLNGPEIDHLELLLSEGYVDQSEIDEFLATGNITDIREEITEADKERAHDEERRGGRVRQ